MSEVAYQDVLLRFGLAVAIGLLIGTERGWHERDLPEGGRVAGVRTFGLIAMLGALWAILAAELGEALLGFALLALTGAVVAMRLRAMQQQHDYGATTIVAALVTFALGAVAMRGELTIASAGAVIVTILLGTKPVMHRVLERIHEAELYAVLKLLFMTVVMLPVLPDRGFGPWQALNPYEMWLMVVLIASISFVGYLAVRIAGARRGLMFAALAGGLTSSTAVTVTFARLARDNPELKRLLAAGIVLASGTMFPRMVVIAVAVAPGLLAWLIWPLGLATLACGLAALVLWRRESAGPLSPELELRNPFEFEMALKFGALLVAISLVARAFHAWLGDAGIYLVALISGLADVDAVTLSLARMEGDNLLPFVAAAGILVAGLCNTVVKGVMSWLVGGAGIGRLVAPVFLLAIAAGGAGIYVARLLAGSAGG